MFHVRNDRRRWRLRWPWRWIFPLKVVERYCRECGFAFNDGPLPQEVASYREGDVSLQVFPAGKNRRGELTVRVGRWQSSRQGPYLGDFIPADELDDLVSVAWQALDGYRAGVPDRRAPR